MKKRAAADVLCTVCGAAIADCKIGGLHGAIRDSAAAAERQLREGKSK